MKKNTLDPILFDDRDKDNQFEFIPEPFLNMMLIIKVYRNEVYAGSCQMSLEEWRSQDSIEQYVEIFNRDMDAWKENMSHD
jgi:hypothetical protein